MTIDKNSLKHHYQQKQMIDKSKIVIYNRDGWDKMGYKTILCHDFNNLKNIFSHCNTNINNIAQSIWIDYVTDTTTFYRSLNNLL